MSNSSFFATLFQVTFTPDNGTLSFNLNGVSQISGKVILEFQVLGYGYSVYHGTIDPCADDTLKGLCPMNQGAIPNLPSNAEIPQSTVSKVPNAIYYIPDIDGKVRVWINSTDGTPLACVEAELTNTKTVNQKAVAWTVAVIVGLGLAISAIISGLGHSVTAAHVAANALSLFSYFQAQAFIGMTSVESPPIVEAWTQNFQWSMGLIRVGFLQKMATWYQRSTGGTPSTYLSALSTASVQVQKRSLAVMGAVAGLTKRSNSATTNIETMKVLTVSGIKRVGFKGNIELTNIFFTGYIFLVIFVMFVTLGVFAFKFICEALIKSKKLKPEQFHDFRNGWTLVLKGILFRIVLIAFPQMVVLCFWELTQRDSSAEVVLAISTVVTMIILLAWASLKVWRIARRSIALHQNPAYILYSDPNALNKWGFLYVQFKASMYYFVVFCLGYILIKGMFIALGQGSPTLQAIALVIIEAAFLIAISIMRPYMDKKTNAFNISIASINLFNVILLLFFTGIFNMPALAIGIMGVLFFIVNAIFALIVILMVAWVSFKALTTKNPDSRYQPMRDDRASFIKSQNSLGGTQELDALGATARGDQFAAERKRMDLEDEDDSMASSQNVSQVNRPQYNQQEMGYSTPQEPPRSATASPYGYSNPASRSAQQFRAQNTASPNMWQRGVGY
ncbi:TRP-domain-containing protein [Microthyrium microscopicum]|uniref:TRP-domain-containing protein n=1 Tax=Microthyrium microscopicum TaxID=703497 RepID=A0A6A6U372_9PEZI|nr:TRP-domain-containing protein [Microthyrium microscopicum]